MAQLQPNKQAPSQVTTNTTASPIVNDISPVKVMRYIIVVWEAYFNADSRNHINIILTSFCI